MTLNESREITTKRFGNWADRMASRVATPVLCVSVGHGKHSGEVNVFTPVDVPGQVLVEMLHPEVAAPTHEGTVWRRWPV